MPYSTALLPGVSPGVVVNVHCSAQVIFTIIRSGIYSIDGLEVWWFVQTSPVQHISWYMPCYADQIFPQSIMIGNGEREGGVAPMASSLDPPLPITLSSLPDHLIGDESNQTYENYKAILIMHTSLSALCPLSDRCPLQLF